MIKFRTNQAFLWLLVSIFTTVGITANSASLNLITDGPVSTAVADFDYIDGAELSGFDIGFSSGPEAGNLASIFFDPSFSLLSLIDLEGDIGEITDFGFLDNLIELQVEPFADFTFGALITLTNFTFGAGKNPIAEIILAGDAFYSDINVQVQAIATPPTPIPLSGSVMFLLFGAIVFAGLGKTERLLRV
ncbi:MAG: hypothetical protein ABJ246_06680 [Paracoccaceae bacterium]